MGRSLFCGLQEPPEAAATLHGHAAPVPITSSRLPALVSKPCSIQGHGQPGSQLVSWWESSWLGVLQGITAGDGRGQLWPLSRWKRRKQPGRFCLFASPLQREGRCNGAVRGSHALSASLLCYKKGRWDPRITTHSTGSGQSWSHYLHKAPSDVNGL